MGSESSSSLLQQPTVVISSTGTTTVPLGNPATPTTNLQPAPMVVNRDDYSGRPPQRIFIGPMPKNELPPPLPEPPDKFRALKRKLSSLTSSSDRRDDSTDEIRIDDVDDRHAFLYFLHQGGRKEDWTEETETSIRHEILRKWKESGWATARAKKKKGRKSTGPSWVGSTFEVGQIPGVGASLDGLQTSSPETTSEASSIHSTATPITPQSPTDVLVKPELIESLTSTEPSGLTFFTARETLNTSGYHLEPRISLAESTSSFDPNSPSTANRLSTASTVPLLKAAKEKGRQRLQSTPDLLKPDSGPSVAVASRSETDLTNGRASAPLSQGIKSAFKKSSTSDTQLDIKDKGKRKAKAVTFPPEPEIIHEEEEEPAADVKEVLTRQGSKLEYTSAGASKAASSSSKSPDFGDVLMRDRMLIRVAHTRQVVKHYDEQYSRNITDLDEERWEEFLVVWRAQRIELYQDYTFPGKERALKRKRLTYIIPLNGVPRAKLSVFSFADMSFCLTTPPAHYDDKAKTKFRLSDEGTDIYVFKHKCRSRAVDWIWKLWREIGGDIPEDFDIHCPVLDMKIRLTIPVIDADAEEGWKTFSLDRVLDLCKQSLSVHKDYKYLIQRALESGRQLGLAWRYGSYLDWIWLQNDIRGVRRHWAVIYGLAIRLPSFLHPHARPILEVRVAEYMPLYLSLADETKMHEPPAIEGFLWRIRPNTQTKVLVYLTTHDGYLFIIPSSKTYLPQPPPGPDEDIQAAAQNSSPEAELKRGTAQILQADAIIDLRNICLIRRATGTTVVTRDPQAARLAAAAAKSAASVVRLDRIPTNESDDDLDSGGEDNLEESKNASEMRVKRSFEFVMRSGFVIRFEAYSCEVTVEWIRKLRKLISYWTRRHRVDARFEMDIRNVIVGLPANGRSPGRSNEAPPLHNPDDVSQYLAPFYNWTVLKGLRPIIRCGRVFLKNGIHEPFTLTQLLLVTGHLLTFPIKEGNDTRAYQKSKTINLLDTYVCSGRFATKALPPSVVQDGAVPRRYQDGLECDDKEQDTMIVLWHVKHPIDSAVKNPKACDTEHNYKQINLSSTRKVLVVKARSRLERDAWCNALNAEIERLVRRHHKRETDMCEAGGLVEIKSRQIKRPTRSLPPAESAETPSN